MATPHLILPSAVNADEFDFNRNANEQVRASLLEEAEFDDGDADEGDTILISSRRKTVQAGQVFPLEKTRKLCNGPRGSERHDART